MRNTQNIFDNPEFFEGYRQIRRDPNNYNLLLEHPAFYRMLPDLAGKTVLDMGCGFGEMCVEYKRRGAARVIGIDLSEKMLGIARENVRDPDICFYQLDMCEIEALGSSFDVITSSLAIHYVEDFRDLAEQVFRCLRKGGTFLFSQEHPLSTAPMQGPEYDQNQDGNGIHYHLTDYGRSGKRSSAWMVDNVVNYHRMFSEIINTLLECGFRITRVEEPLPDAETLKRNPGMQKEFHKPSFLLLRAEKE